MTHIEQAIEEAIEKGGYSRARWTSNEAVLLDPQFFQALGKARGWSEKPLPHKYRVYNCEAWLQWHRFIDHLAEGETAESFFAQLT